MASRWWFHPGFLGFEGAEAHGSRRIRKLKHSVSTMRGYAREEEARNLKIPTS